MTRLCCKVLEKLAGKSLVTAESLTGGGIGAVLTSVPGASAVYKGGIICYSNETKAKALDVPKEILRQFGAVSAQTAEAMASGAFRFLDADVAVSVTGLAGPDGDEFGNPVGRVFIGYCDKSTLISRRYTFSGDREAIRRQTVETALRLILQHNGGDFHPV